MSGFDSFIASHEIRISFLIHMHILFFPIILCNHIFRYNNYINLKQLVSVFIKAASNEWLPLCLNYCGIVEESCSVQTVKSRSIYSVKIPPKTLRICPSGWSEAQSVDVGLLKKPAAVEQHVGAWGLHQVLRHLSDRRVIEMVPGPSHGTVAQRRVVAHVQVTCVILEKANGG